MLYHASSVTGRRYSTRTVNGRLRRLAMFYNWAFRRGLIARVPFDYDTVRAPVSGDAQLLAHLRTHDTLSALDLTVREYRSIPTALSVDDLRRVRGHLSSRDALIADWAVSTGARRAEVLSLSVSDIPDSHALGNTPFVPVPIIGKGGRRRALQVPLPIIDRTNPYISECRTPILRRRSGVDPDATHTLWIGAEGKSVTAKTLSKRFSSACDKAGVRATFHSAAHVRDLHACHADAPTAARGDGHVNAVKTLQLLLGHASLHTTSTYLNAVRLDPQRLSRSINDLYQTLQ